MYHEEMIIDGVLYWRSKPNGVWIESKPESLTSKIVASRAECDRLLAVNKELLDALERMPLIEANADGLRGTGMVDNSDIKAIRAMSTIARDAIAHAQEVL